jgi:hypothetical protein
LKTHPNPQGPNILANDALGTTIMRGLGFSVPEWRPIRISLKALRCFPELLMETEGGRLVPSCGYHFGSEFLGGPGYDTFDLMPGSSWHRVRNAAEFQAVVLFDIWANHRDERQCVFWKKCKDNRYSAMFIDNGHLFGGPAWDQLSACRRISSTEMNALSLDFSGIETTLTLFEQRIPQLLKEATSRIPTDWYQGDINLLHDSLLIRLEKLRMLITGETEKHKNSFGWWKASAGSAGRPISISTGYSQHGAEAHRGLY